MQVSDFWLASGHHMLDRDEAGWLVPTAEFVKLYLARPEIVPPPEACGAEHALHAALLLNPWRPVGKMEIDAIADADARENWHQLVTFRDQLSRSGSLEAAYIAFASQPNFIAPIFLDHLAQLILRNILDRCDDVVVLRAAELFFRPQRITVHDGSLLAADREFVAASQSSPLVAMLGQNIEVISSDNAGDYWGRSDRFDFALDLTAQRRGMAALAEVITQWIRHLLQIEVDVKPLAEFQSVALSWYVGLDAEGTKIGDALWREQSIDEATEARIVGLFELTVGDQAALTERMAGETVYLIMAMTPDGELRFKPQNLVTGLPLRMPRKTP
jgi:Family of unknown function (DUF6352)